MKQWDIVGYVIVGALLLMIGAGIGLAIWTDNSGWLCLTAVAFIVILAG